jgi:hypothetical protein
MPAILVEIGEAVELGQRVLPALAHDMHVDRTEAAREGDVPLRRELLAAEQQQLVVEKGAVDRGEGRVR